MALWAAHYHMGCCNLVKDLISLFLLSEVLLDRIIPGYFVRGFAAKGYLLYKQHFGTLIQQSVRHDGVIDWKLGIVYKERS